MKNTIPRIQENRHFLVETQWMVLLENMGGGYLVHLTAAFLSHCLLFCQLGVT